LPVGTTTVADTVVANAYAAESARVPLTLADWEFRSTIDSSSVLLRVRAPAGSAILTEADKNRIRFFVDSASVIDHAATQTVRIDGDALELRIPRSQYATAIPGRVTGVLALAGKDKSDEGFVMEVVAPVVSVTQFASDIPMSGSVGTSDAAGGNGWLALVTAGLFALLGGTLLNLMPCVLPVLSIKALGVAESAAHDARTARRHTLLFGAGVLVSMWGLVAMLLALRAAGNEVGWGFQLQSPAMVGTLALIVFAAALNMAGVFEFSPVGGTLAVAAGRKPPVAEAFLSGVLVTALATPCSAPFLAAAVAYGIAGGAATAVVVFTAMGIGLIWPIALVAAVPRVRTWLPKPGAWMVTLRQALAFPLVATVVWLAWVLGRQAGVDALTALLVAMTVLAFGLWALGRFGTVAASNAQRRTAQGVAVAASVGAIALVISVGSAASSTANALEPSGIASTAETGAVPWQPYSAASLDSLRNDGRIVLLDFTADWCLTCKVNERVAFGSDAVRTSLQTHNVALMQADWTKRDPEITRALAAFNRNSVPFVVLYGRDRSAAPIVLPTLLTPGIVTRALDAAAAAPAPTVSAATAR
jgi:thiol:disulfide interchange protein DsbD